MPTSLAADRCHPIPVEQRRLSDQRPLRSALEADVSCEHTDRGGSMSDSRRMRFKGIFPVAPTIFTETGELDLEGQKRCIDFMIDAGSNGICILANFSEQFAVSDSEREVLTKTILTHVAGRVPVIVTTTHFSSRVCTERSRRARDQ